MNEIDPIELGRQLMKPSGEFGKLVAKNMNISSGAIYSLACTMIDFKDNDRILEVGFGNGKFFSNYFNINPKIRVFGIDYSDTMISEATSINHEFINNKKLSLKCEDLLNTSFDIDSFDIIITINTVYFWDPFNKHIDKISGLLKRGGKLIIGFSPKNVMENLPFTEEVFRLYESSEIRGLLQRHKFKIVDEKMQNISKKSTDGKDINSIIMCIAAENFNK